MENKCRAINIIGWSGEGDSRQQCFIFPAWRREEEQSFQNFCSRSNQRRAVFFIGTSGSLVLTHSTPGSCGYNSLRRTDGSMDSRMYHLGCPVLFGAKWIGVKWVRWQEQVIYFFLDAQLFPFLFDFSSSDDQTTDVASANHKGDDLLTQQISFSWFCICKLTTGERHSKPSLQS